MEYAEFFEFKKGIFIVTFHGEEISNEGFHTFLQALETLYRESTNLIIIFDGSNTHHLPPKMRQEMGLWIKKNKTLIRESCVLQIYVIHSTLMRFVLQGIFLIQKPPVSFKTISNLEDAKALALEIVDSLEGVPQDQHL